MQMRASVVVFVKIICLSKGLTQKAFENSIFWCRKFGLNSTNKHNAVMSAMVVQLGQARFFKIIV